VTFHWIGFEIADNSEPASLGSLHIEYLDLATHVNFACARIAWFDDHGVLELALDVHDGSLDERLLLLGLFVLGILREITESFGFLDALCDAKALLGLQPVELFKHLPVLRGADI
jgi:hypothetical protein